MKRVTGRIEHQQRIIPNFGENIIYLICYLHYLLTNTFLLPYISWTGWRLLPKLKRALSYLLGISYVHLLLPSGPLPKLIRFQLKMHIFLCVLANVHTKTIKIICAIIFKFRARSSFLSSSTTKDRANRLTALMALGRHVFGTAKMSEKRLGMKTHILKSLKVKNAPEFCPEVKKRGFWIKRVIWRERGPWGQRVLFVPSFALANLSYFLRPSTDARRNRRLLHTGYFGLKLD